MKKETLGSFLKLERQKLGYYQKDMAAAIGISRMYYLRLENDYFSSVSAPLAKRIADVTKTPITHILKLLGDK